jgi:hypothetical protein
MPASGRDHADACLDRDRVDLGDLEPGDRMRPDLPGLLALTVARRLKAMGQARYRNDGRPPAD